MRRLIDLCGVSLLALLLVVILAGCKPEPEPVYPQRVSLEEASEILGVPVPYPAYLPYGYEIKAVYFEVDKPDVKHVSIFISDEEIDDEQLNDVNNIPWKMRLIVVWFTRQMPPSMKCGGEGIWIRTDSGGCIFRSTTHNSLLWQWRPDKSKNEMFEFDLTENIDIPIEELVSIARSVQPYWVPSE
jgi:hypothetical protein